MSENQPSNPLPENNDVVFDRHGHQTGVRSLLVRLWHTHGHSDPGHGHNLEETPGKEIKDTATGPQDPTSLRVAGVENSGDFAFDSIIVIPAANGSQDATDHPDTHPDFVILQDPITRIKSKLNEFSGNLTTVIIVGGIVVVCSIGSCGFLLGVVAGYNLPK